MYVKAIRKICAPDNLYEDLETIQMAAEYLGLKFLCHNGVIYYQTRSGWEQTPLNIEDLEATAND
jgi:hypothetical protein